MKITVTFTTEDLVKDITARILYDWTKKDITDEDKALMVKLVNKHLTTKLAGRIKNEWLKDDDNINRDIACQIMDRIEKRFEKTEAYQIKKDEDEKYRRERAAYLRENQK